MGGEMRCWSGQNKLLSAKKYNRTFFLYGDFYLLPIYNLLNFKFLKKKIPPFLLGLETFRQQLKTNKFISMDGLINCLKIANLQGGTITLNHRHFYKNELDPDIFFFTSSLKRMSLLIRTYRKC